MSGESQQHGDVIDGTVEIDGVQSAGSGSMVYHESETPTLGNERDERTNKVLIRRDIIPDAGDLLVELLRFEPGANVGKHKHEGTRHFFYILEGSGAIDIEGEEIPLEEGSVVWIGDGDLHRMRAADDEHMLALQYFSNDHHQVTFVEGDGHTWDAQDE